MKILHLCLNGPYTEGWGYQDNILPKYHKLSGNEVTVVTTLNAHSPSGEIVTIEPCSYITECGVKVIRIKPKHVQSKKLEKLMQLYPVYEILREESPDFIMVHGFIGSLSELDVRKYKKNINKDCTVVADLHQDYYNNPKIKLTFRSYLIQAFYKFHNRFMYQCYERIFCITPESMRFAREYYNAPKEKLQLLPLGYDPQLLEQIDRLDIRTRIRRKYNIAKSDVVIVHGGKLIPIRKTQETIDSVAALNKPNVKLIVFGAVSEECAAAINERVSKYSSWLIYTGHMSQKDYYELYLASDIAVFPGGQSAIWQEAIGCGLPLLICDVPGVEYLDRGGNVKFIKDATVESIREGLEEVIRDNVFKKMSETAKSIAANFFSYRRIAEQVLSVNQKENTK